MDARVRNLALLLAAQLVLAAALGYAQWHASASEPAVALLAPGAPIDHIVVDGGGGGQITTLALKDGRWVLPDWKDFPADQAKVAAFITRITGLKRGPPVATSSDAPKRFKVADDAYERRIVLQGSGKPLGTLYLGSALDARRANGRAAGDNAVYALGIASVDVPPAPGDWADKTVLQVAKATMASIDVDGLTLVHDSTATPSTTSSAAATPPTWHASAGLGAGERLETAAVDSLADTLATLVIGAPLGRDVQPGDLLEPPALSLTLKRQDGTTVAYQLGGKRTTGDRVLKTSLRPEVFTVPAFEADRLLHGAERATLVHPDIPPGAAAGAKPAPGPKSTPASGQNSTPSSKPAAVPQKP